MRGTEIKIGFNNFSLKKEIIGDIKGLQENNTGMDTKEIE
jgi:hypothetical protein